MALNFLNNGYFAGKVGIGKLVPTKELDVVGDAKVLGTLTVETSNNNIRLLDSNDSSVNFSVGVNGKFQVRDVAAATSPFEIEKAAPSDSLYIDSAGNVGIGTTSPDTNLEVESSTGGVLRLTSSDTTVLTGESIGKIEFKSNDASTGGNNVMGFIDSVATNVGTRYALSFGTGDAAAAVERMRITNLGGISFGTTGTAYGTSGQILKSNGNASPTWIDGSAIPGVPAGSGTLNTIPLWTPDGDTLGNSVMTQSGANIGIGTTSYTNSSGYSTLNINGTSGGQIAFQTAGASKHFIWGTATEFNIYNGEAGNLILYTAAAERMRINSSGDVLMGNTVVNPASNFSTQKGFGYKFSTGQTEIAATSDVPTLTLGRNLSNDGSILDLRKEGTVIGQFGSNTTGGQPLLDISANVTNGNMRFLTAGSERMRITSTGNVGIGTTSPAAGLQVAKGGTTIPTAGSSTASAVFGNSTSDDNYGVAIGANSSGVGYISSQRTDGTATTYNLAIQPNGGNVGIGTAGPISKFTVTGTDNTNQANIGHSTQSVYIKVNGTNVDYNSSGNSSGSHTFSTGNIERMRITSGGNVGIGTTSPNEKLEVSGKVYIESQGVDWNETTPGLTRGALHFDPVGSGADDTGNAITFGASDRLTGTNAQAGIYTRTDGAYGTKMYFATTDSYTAGSKTRMMIDYNGYVGIGDTDPKQKLHIVDTDGANIILNSNTGAENNGIWMTEGGVATPYVNGSYVHYDSTNNEFKINTGAASLATRFTIARDTGAIKFNSYNSTNNTGTPTYLLGTDASGNVVKTNTVPGSGAGPYLPLSAGTGFPLTGDLYQTMGAIGVAQTDQDYLAKIYESNADGFMSLYTGQPTPLERIRISSYGDSFFVPANNGNVGIGTTAPGAKLDVNGATYVRNVIYGYAGSGNQYGGLSWNGTDSGFLFAKTGNVTQVLLDSSGNSYLNGGNVGIGTTSPAQNFVVADATNGNGIELVPGATATIQTYNRGTSSYNNLNIDTARTQIRSIDYTSFHNGSGYGEKMRIEADGTVLIGTPSSAYDTTQGYPLHAMSDLTSQSYISVARKGQTSGSAGLVIGLDTTNAYLLVRDNIPLILGTNNLSHVFIKPGGNVGIGNTGPNYKLSVSGGIEAGGLVTYSKVAGSLSTTGYAVAGLTAGFNGASAGFEFKCYGSNSKYQRIVYSCHCSGTTWVPGKVIDEGTNDLDVVASANGATITFTFKARSSTQNFSPRIVIQATGHSINSTYA